MCRIDKKREKTGLQMGEKADIMAEKGRGS